MQRTHRSRRLVAILGAAALVSACDDTTGVDGLDDDMIYDAALVAADATVEEVTMWAQPFGFGGSPTGVGGPAATPGRPGGLGDWSTELSGTRSVTFYAADGTEQDAFDPDSTESIHFVREIEGTITREQFTAEISRLRDMTVSGLLGEETHRTWNGSGSSLMTRSGTLEDGSQRSHSIEGSFTFDDVVVPIPGSDPPYPVSGTITREMTVTRTTPDGSVTRTVEIVITFDGSATATALVNGEEVEIDLSARDHRTPLRRPRPGG